jgi:hypothetical protein
MENEKDIIKKFENDGIIALKDYFSSNQLIGISDAIVQLYLNQHNKIGDYPEIKLSENLFETMNKIVLSMEENDKEALYQVQNMIPCNLQILQFFTKENIELFAQLLGVTSKDVMVSGPGLFINNPGTERLLYKYHNESHYYPKRRNFLNIWMPIFHNKTRENGAMRVKLKSHNLVDQGFVEYTGYNKNTEGKASHFIQYEVPEVFHKECEEFICEYELGDLVIFKRNLLHTSNANTTKLPSYALVYRIWEGSKDLTLSGDFTIRPYSGKDGRSNLNIRP